jgi:hypothetical protein
MPAPAKRPWFQFHLSTAVVLMFVAAGLLWLNVHPSPVAPILDPDIDIGLQVDANARPFGWPIIAVYTCGAADTSRVAKIHQSAAAFDLFLALSILLAAGASLEWLIRRKQRRKAEAGRNP